MNIYTSMAILYLLLINNFENAIIFSICFIVTMVLSSFILSFLKPIIQSNTKVVASLLITASIITLIELILKKYIPIFYNDMYVYLPLMMLIIYDFNSKKDTFNILKDTLNKAIRYSLILIVVVLVKELLTNGTITFVSNLSNILGFSLIFRLPENNLLPLNTPGLVFIIVGLILGLINKYRRVHA